MSADTEKKPPRKFPPPCWTQEEALSLIEAYRERWYALRRGYLRTADWDAVAAAVGQRFPGASPAKTSAQCRHKMEKLRQRYRVEKQRSLSSYPGRFFSSWFFYESMDAMEHGSTTVVGSNQENHQNLVTIGFYPKNNVKKESISNSSAGLDHAGVDPAAGFRIKTSASRNSVPLGFCTNNSAKSRVSNGPHQYSDFGSDDDGDEGGQIRGEFRVTNPINGSLISQEYRANKSGKISRKTTTRFDRSNGEDDGVDFSGGCQLNTQIEQDFGFRANKSSKVNHDWDDGSCNRVDVNGDFWVKVAGNRNPVPPLVRGNRHLNPNSSISPAFEKRRGGGAKRVRSPVAEMVESIKYLGEGFVEVEKMKMEMVKEIEKMRMEMEVKRNEMLLKSQQQIVDAFVKGLFNGKKKVNAAASPDS